MRILTLHNVNDFEHLDRPDTYRGVSLASPALDILTDFRLSMPFVVESSINVLETEAMMKRAHVRLKFVIDKDERFLGIVTVSDLSKDNLQKYLDAGFQLEDITASQVMTPRSALKAFDYDELAEASIGDLLTSLQLTNLHHCLVKEKSTGMIRGLISASDFAKKMNIPMPYEGTPSFITLYNTLVERQGLMTEKAG